MTYSNSFGRAAASSRRPSPSGRYDRAAWSPPCRRRTRPLFAQRRLPTRRIALIAALACVLVGGCWFAASTLGGLVAGAQEPGAGSPAAPQSTPRDQWRAGEVPELYQRDPAWAQTSYAGDDFGETGCGPTCLAMAYVALTGRDDRGPADLAALSEQMGCATPDGTAWAFMTEGAAEVGLAAEELPADEGSIRRALAAGSPVVCSVGPGDFTTTGHFIVLAGVDKDGRLVVRDPNSPERTAKAWDFDVVIGQCRALWAYTAA
ncbi:C39 family peptidase [Arabiibacter massiliensis]|uniref:C39 family peptidase n=1 Tax=Arabiibacter massiliensis TaxID=1870985 RepID=UPI0009B94FA4|nr:C39 family peptidase [Arabiibacter massiliensis]